MFLILIISALVNKGNVLYARGDYEKAREFFKEALQNDSSCVEGLYNLGTVNQIGFYKPCLVIACFFVNKQMKTFVNC